MSTAADRSQIKFELIDLTGKILFVDDQKGVQDKYFLNMKSFSAGSYLLILSTTNGELIHSFKIQKLN